MSKPMLRSPLAVTRLNHALSTGGLSQTRPNDQATPALSTSGLSQARSSDLCRSETLSTELSARVKKSSPSF